MAKVKVDVEEVEDQLQQEDKLLDYAIHYCVNGSYPEGLSKDKKRAVRKKAKTITVERGEVFVIRKGKKVIRCVTCQKINKKIDSVRPELFPVPVKSPWYHLGMDFIGPISPPSKLGNKYILTVSDYFTKFAWTIALPSKEALPIVKSLKQLFFVMGLPAIITTDQDREFRNKVNNELTSAFGIDHRLTTAYPQANGLDERFNQTLINSLSKFAQTSRDSWDENLDAVIYAYNSSVQESTKYTPFEVMFGRRARLPVDINMEGEYSPENTDCFFATHTISRHHSQFHEYPETIRWY